MELNRRLGISATEDEWIQFNNAVKHILNTCETALDFQMPSRIQTIADAASKRLIADFDGASSRDLMHLYGCMVLGENREALAMNSSISTAIQKLVQSRRFFPNESKKRAE